NDDLRGIGAKKDEFIQVVLPKYGKTLYEWEQDVIRPRLLLGKMCRDRVRVNENEVRRLYEHRYGEKRQAQVIVYPKGQEPPPQTRDAIRANPEEFDRAAASQPTREFAQVAGRMTPVAKFTDEI